MKYHYVYRITNKENNKHYYGVRSSKIEPKLDLGIKYFSSSTDKEFMNEQKLNKDKFKYKIIKTFDTRKEAELIEVKLHTKFEVQNNNNFYNKAKSTLMGFSVEGRKQTREHIEKRIKGYAGKTFEEIYGVDRAKEIKEILSRPKSEEHKKKLSLAKTGVKLTPEHVQAVTKAIKLRYLDENYEFLTYGKENGKSTFWADIYDGNQGFIVYGHQWFQEIKKSKFALGIDTGCVYGNKLSAIVFPNIKEYPNYKIYSQKALF